MEDLIEFVWGLLNYEIDFSVAGLPLEVSMWQIFMASTLIYILVCFAKYLTGREGDI